MTEPWVFEAGNFDFSQDIESILLRNELINKYLEIGHRDKKLFLVGPKGIGKTFLLSYKSFLFRKNHSADIKFAPSKELTENLMIFFSQFSRDEIVKYQTPDIWENIWKFVLLAVSCKTYGFDIENELKLSGEDFSSVSSTLSYILGDRKALVKNLSQFLPRLISKSRCIQSSIVMFLDGIDQAVNVLVEKKFYDYETYSDLPVKIWGHIHVGIAKSIYDISQLNSHIKIYTTLRSEAFKLIPGGMALNLEGFAVNLSYSPSELKLIFTNNVKITDENKLINNNASDSIEKFLGYSEMTNPFVANAKENSLDFLLRHTLGRPREMVYLGNKLFFEKLSKPDYRQTDEQERIEDIRFFINEKSEEIINNYLNEIIPSFDIEYLIKFLKKIQSNIFHHKILNDEEKKFLGICYNIGLIGIISHKTDKFGKQVKVQYFKKAGDYLYHNLNQYPKSEYYITHPILDCYFLKIFNLDFYNNRNIIGNNYEFKDIEYLYDIAVSYAGEDRHIVDAVTQELKQRGLKIFYDKDYEKQIVGENLIDYLHNVYKKSAKQVIVFLSENYLKSKWTTYEWATIKQKLVLNYTSNFLKMVKIDDAPTPEIVESIAYIDARNKSPKEIGELIN